MKTIPGAVPNGGGPGIAFEAELPGLYAFTTVPNTTLAVNNDATRLTTSGSGVVSLGIGDQLTHVSFTSFQLGLSRLFDELSDPE